jgi:hypothetical protein
MFQLIHSFLYRLLLLDIFDALFSMHNQLVIYFIQI